MSTERNLPVHREIIKIDEEKCDGCGLCVPACAEGAIQVIDGKAKLVSEVYCDGLGACLGECPQGALTIETREADTFDEEAVERYLQSKDAEKTNLRSQPESEARACSFTCPGAASQVLQRQGMAPSAAGAEEVGGIPAQLGQWPVQLHLVPVNAPYFQDADLLIAADCVPFAFADFHRKFLKGRALVVGCPKLDDVEIYRRKLTEIFRQNDIRMVEVAHMEVPCCYGLVQLVRAALRESGKQIPLVLTKVGIRGEILERSQPASAAN
jgi:ferredoxin